jgi:hypothetical protein
MPSNGFTTFINDPDQGPYLVRREYALKNPPWTEKQDKVGKGSMLTLLNRGFDVTTKPARKFIASRVNMEAELGNLAAIAAGKTPAVGDTIKRDHHAVKHKLAKWLQELYKKGRITEAAKDTAIDGLQLQCIQLQGQLTTANNLKEELQRKVATLEEQLKTAQAKNDELPPKKRKRENDNVVDIA